MKLNHIRDFLAVAEHASLRAAARELGIAQPAITRSIQELEKELGVSLFERHARGAVPTAMGEAFLRRARCIQGEVVRARDEIEQLRGIAHGQVTVAMSMAPHMALLPHTLRPFRRRYADVTLDIIDAVFPTVMPQMIDGTIDCYIGPQPPQLPEGLVMELLFENARIIVGRKGHPLSAARSLRQVAQAEWISTSITARPEEELGPLFEAHGLAAPKTVLRAHSALTLMVSLMSSDMLTMLPVQWADFPLTQGALQTIAVAEPLAAPAIVIVRRASLPLTPAAEFFCDLIRRASVQLGKPAPVPVKASQLRKSVATTKTAAKTAAKTAKGDKAIGQKG